MSADFLIIQWNVHGYYGRLPHIQALLDRKQPSVFAIQESWLKPSNTVRLPQYTILRKDRTDRNCGGVCLCISDRVPFVSIQINSKIEAVAAKVFVGSVEICICSVYIPPDYSNMNLEQHLQS